MRKLCRSLIVLFVMGTLVSAQQVSAENVFDTKGDLELEKMAFEIEGSTGESGLFPASARSDTLETYEVELEEDSEASVYRQIAVAAVVAAFVGYILIQYLKPDEEEEASKSNIKEIPTSTAGLSVSFSW